MVVVAKVVGAYLAVRQATGGNGDKCAPFFCESCEAAKRCGCGNKVYHARRAIVCLRLIVVMIMGIIVGINSPSPSLRLPVSAAAAACLLLPPLPMPLLSLLPANTAVATTTIAVAAGASYLCASSSSSSSSSSSLGGVVRGFGCARWQRVVAPCRDGQRRRLPAPNAGHRSRGRGEELVQVLVMVDHD